MEFDIEKMRRSFSAGFHAGVQAAKDVVTSESPAAGSFYDQAAVDQDEELTATRMFAAFETRVKAEIDYGLASTEAWLTDLWFHRRAQLARG